MAVPRRLFSIMVIGLIPGLALASCTTSRPAKAALGNGTGPAARAKVTVTYSESSRSSPGDHASIVYTDPTTGVDSVIPAPATWHESWLIPATQVVVLQVEVVGPYPTSNSCEIRVNGRPVTTGVGRGIDIADTPVICAYAWPAQNA
jgi:hypothetical protein